MTDVKPVERINHITMLIGGKGGEVGKGVLPGGLQGVTDAQGGSDVQEGA